MIVFYKDVSEYKKLEAKLESLGHIIDKSINEVFIFDAYTLEFSYINQEAQKHIGYSFKEMKNMSPMDIKPEYTEESFKRLVKPLLSGEKSNIVFETIHKCKNGDIYNVEIRLELIDIENKKQFVVIAHDITQRKESLRKLKESEAKLKLLAQAIQQTDEMVRIIDKDGTITYVNDALSEHTGYSKEELIGSDSSVFNSSMNDDAFYKEMWNTVLSGKTYRGIFINRKKSGDIFYEEETITPIFDSNKKILNFVVTSQDITRRIAMENELQKLATVDSLTGTYNRHKTNEEIDSQIARSKRYNESFTLVMFDIDYFKEVNDNYGHAVGDYVLKELSSIILEDIRESDIFGRWGGEEFMLLLPKLNKIEALGVADKIKDLISTHNFEKVSKVTVSIGVSTYSNNDTKEKLLKKVDEALYKAKGDGRNSIAFK